MNNLTSYINNEIKPLKHTDSIAEAQDLFLDFPYTHFPVTEDGTYIGCVSKENVELLNSDAIINDSRFHFERFFVRNTTIWLDVLEIFAKNESNLIPVLDDKNQYVGFYELDDVLHFLNETTFVKEDGGIIVIEKETEDFTFSQICQIVESNGSKVLGVFVSNTSLTLTQITLKISQNNFNEIIQTFRRYNYTILSEHQEDSYLAGLKERSDYLDKYLNI